jgi:hypothetical protein
VKESNLSASTAADARLALLNGGYLRFYDGTEPATVNTAITTQNLLAELRWNATAFGAAVNGVAVANAITSGTAVANGTAAWFRAFKSDGTSAIFDGSIGTSGADINLDDVVFSIGGVASVSSYVYTQPKG